MKTADGNIKKAEVVNTNAEVVLSPAEVVNTTAEVVSSPAEMVNTTAAVVLSPAAIPPSIDIIPVLNEDIESLKQELLKALHDLSAYIKKAGLRCSMHHADLHIIVTKGTCYEACNPEVFEGALGHDPDT